MILPKEAIEEIEKTGVKEARFMEIVDKVSELIANQIVERVTILSALPMIGKEFKDETERALAFMSLGMIVTSLLEEQRVS